MTISPRPRRDTPSKFLVVVRDTDSQHDQDGRPDRVFAPSVPRTGGKIGNRRRDATAHDECSKRFWCCETRNRTLGFCRFCPKGDVSIEEVSRIYRPFVSTGAARGWAELPRGQLALQVVVYARCDVGIRSRSRYCEREPSETRSRGIPSNGARVAAPHSPQRQNSRVRSASLPSGRSTGLSNSCLQELHANVGSSVPAFFIL